jgi:hypothetical protein
MNLQKIATGSDFEQSFFQLAYEKLQEKLQNLLPFLVGFEVVNKSDDGTKALGVFGFKSNNGQIVYVPAFFVNGDVKGIDILYSKNNEQFYPLNEDFAEFFLKDDATGLGDTSKQKEQEILRNTTQSVDMKDLMRAPRTGKISYASVIDYVQDGDNLTKKAFHQLLEKDDKFMESVLRFYPVEKVAAAIAPKPVKPVQQKEAGFAMIRIITRSGLLPGMPSDIKKSVLSKGYGVIDDRKEEQVSKFGLIKYPEKFHNPDKTGFYSYLTESGGLRNAMIFVKPQRLDVNFSTDDSIVIDLNAKDGSAYVVPNRDLFVRNQYTIKDLSEVHNKFQELAEVTPSFDQQYILVNERLAASQPFVVLENFKDPAGLRNIRIQYSHPCGHGTSTTGQRLAGNFYTKPNKHFSSILVLTKKSGDTLDRKDQLIYVPKGFKLMPVNQVYSNDNGAKPGKLNVLNAALTEQNVFPLAVRSNGSDYFLNVGQTKTKFDNALNTKIALIKDYGLDEKTAEELVESVPPMGKKEGYIKLAYTGDMTMTPMDPQSYTNEFGQPTYVGDGYSQVLGGQESYTKNPTRTGLTGMPEVEGLDAAISQANQMAQAGQKRIFDTQAIATLAKYVNPAAKIQAYMPDFISCLDKLGRMLFMVYWETEKFEQMYGRGELPELVELLTNVFKNLGDLVVFLKRKNPEISINMEKHELGA